MNAPTFAENGAFFTACRQLNVALLNASHVGVNIERVQINDKGQLLIKIDNNGNEVELAKELTVIETEKSGQQYEQVDFCGCTIIWERSWVT